MKITSIETIQAKGLANLVWVRLFTDEGLVGLGETFRNPEATVSYIHETCASYLLGKDPLQAERHWQQLMYRVGNHFNGYPTRSVEVRGNSAIDIAMWDLCGKATGQSITQLLGGFTRDRIAIYNTCAGGSYNTQLLTHHDMELVRAGDAVKLRPLEDLEASVHRPAELAAELLDEGITAMKIWPFDPAALATGGHRISPAQIHEAVAPIEAIRKAHGSAMDIMLEFHGLWHLPAALEIAHAVEPYDIYWYEDPVSMQNIDDLADYRSRVRGRICGSENLGTKTWYREAFKRGVIDVAHFDIAWIGGITEAKKISALAETYDRPIAPHDCTGPVTLVANLHLAMSLPNPLILETVRAYVRGYYRDVVTELPPIVQGEAHAMRGVGLGTQLSDKFLARADLIVRRSGQ
jgi:galactonate dehydratase